MVFQSEKIKNGLRIDTSKIGKNGQKQPFFLPYRKNYKMNRPETTEYVRFDPTYPLWAVKHISIKPVVFSTFAKIRFFFDFIGKFF